MNTAKKTTLISRLKAAIKAFRGKPIGHLYYGLELKKCSECEYRKGCGERQGRWEYRKYPGGDWWCSNCAGVAYIGKKTPYCPHCGAKMDAKEE